MSFLMPSRLRGVLALAPSSLVLVGLAAGCEGDQLKGPKAEVKPHSEKLDLPGVPAFDLPTPNSDGSKSVKELRVKGKKFLDQEVTVKGYVTWAYDCPTAIRTEKMSDADVQKLIEEDPTKCERPKFYLGDEPSTPPEKSLWVVDVPRPPNKLEKERLPKEEIKNWPAVPPYKVGDEMVVTGRFVLSSPHSERNSDGLIVYEKLRNVTQGNWETPPPPADAPVEPVQTKAAPKH
jgi:hypothetical protein